jgi:thioredoxin-related protein
MQKLTFLTYVGICIVLLGVGAPIHPRVQENFQWLTFQQAQERVRNRPRVILMDMYTDWCYWCKVMDRNTYSQPEIAAYIQEKFYPVKFNAESKGSVTWKGQSFDFNPDYRVNQLALTLTKGRLSYPTMVIITPDDHAPQYLSGYIKPMDLEPVLKYFGEGAYKSMTYKDFKKQFQPSWK